VNELAWIDAAITSARPQAIGALLRWFRDLDVAEEAFQEAALRALRAWPQNGPPRDPIAWLVFVGRNSAVDAVRRRRLERPLPPDEDLPDRGDAEAAMAEALDEGHYRDDILRLLFLCCHPDLPATQQLALALRVVCGLPLPQIARAFLVTEAAMEQRITRAKAAVKGLGVDAPGPVGRAERLAAVSTVLYLMFNEGYSATGEEVATRGALADEAIRLGRLLLRLFHDDPAVMGLLALMLLQHSRSRARFDASGGIILLEDQDRSLWSAAMITEGLALVDKARRHPEPRSFVLQASIASMHARAARFEETDWARIERLYAELEALEPSPVITLNRAVALGKVQGPEAALALIEPLAPRLAAYFHFHGARGAFLLQLGRNAEARESLDRAIALARSAAEATHIRDQIDRLLTSTASPPTRTSRNGA